MYNSWKAIFPSECNKFNQMLEDQQTFHGLFDFLDSIAMLKSS
ncbi:hypothetical protein SAMN02982997_02588 [Legionella micdadei]|uniref:Uncharacterized protein n=1 Tax=Legionella micdadei TaxID=451 RepID=A0A1G5I4G4_LEGMI|nr:hypothetical protein SAMN02982997_02588 [Legionella micdadei]